MKALRGALKDKSPVVRYTYANAASGLAPLTTHTSLKNFVLHLKVYHADPLWQVISVSLTARTYEETIH